MSETTTSTPPQVSFVVPCRNAEATLEACLKALSDLEGCAEEREIVVVDNGSTDSSLAIAREYTDTVLIEPERSIAGLRNIGAKTARGEVLIFVDSDCVLDSEWLQSASPYMNDPEVGMFGSKTHRVPDDAVWVSRAWKFHLDRAAQDPNPSWIVTRAVAVKRQAFFDVGGFDEEKITCEDVALGHKIFEKFKIKSDPKLSPLHLDEPKGLLDFFKKEVWRGRDSIETSFEHIRSAPSISFKELLSLGLPVYYLLLIIGGIVLGLMLGVLASPVLACALWLIALMAPIMLMALDTSRKRESFSSFGGLVAVYGAYILARVWALVLKLKRVTSASPKSSILSSRAESTDSHGCASKGCGSKSCASKRCQEKNEPA